MDYAFIEINTLSASLEYVEQKVAEALEIIKSEVKKGEERDIEAGQRMEAHMIDNKNKFKIMKALITDINDRMQEKDEANMPEFDDDEFSTVNDMQFHINL